MSGDRWRFRIWAPSLTAMGLVVDKVTHGMEPAADGWFEVECTAAPGQTYAFEPRPGTRVPDPAARAQAGDVDGPSRLVDPEAYEWGSAWRGRPWEETIIYELHVGTFSDTNDFDGVRARLDHLAETGVTAIELCPVAQFSGNRGWGYDGVLMYAPHVAYGGPTALKRLVEAAHARGLMVFLDVVYNHFGPDGNYLPLYAPEFFHAERHTPWGAAIAFDQPPVRRFFIENALYWLAEYRIDGLRFDAVDQIEDRSDEPILAEIASAVRAHGFDRPVHLTTEDDRNVTHLHARDEAGRPRLYDGEWNDDLHHVVHVLATGESDGYYGDYAADARGDIMIALAEGFVQQGRPSANRGGKPRGEPSAHLPPAAFVNFLQNHDQTGNRAFGERLTAGKPGGGEGADRAPPFVADDPVVIHGRGVGGNASLPVLLRLRRRSRRGRARRTPARVRALAAVRRPDPPRGDPRSQPAGDVRVLAHRLVGARYRRRPRAAGADQDAHRDSIPEIAPRLGGMSAMNGRARAHGDRGIEARWTLGDGSRLAMIANLGGQPFDTEIAGRELCRIGDLRGDAWALRVTLEEPVRE